MLQNKLFTFGLLMTFLAGLTSVAVAKVSPEEAARLGKDLTPFGAERAGNADGSIPAWDGGLKATPAGIDYKPGGFMPNPFADDKVLYSITAANMDQYAGKLNEGQKAMLKKYPDCPKGLVLYNGEHKILAKQKLEFLPLYSIASICRQEIIF